MKDIMRTEGKTVTLFTVTLLVFLVSVGSAQGDPQPRCNAVADIVFILDSSGSVGTNNFQLQRNFVADVISNFDVGPDDVQFGCLVFSYYHDNYITLGEFDKKQQLLQKVTTLPFYGSTTATGPALESARLFSFSPENGARSGVAKIAIVLTDGYSDNSTDTWLKAKLLQNSGVTVIAMGIGCCFNPTELLFIASDPSLVYHISSYSALSGILTDLTDTVCEQQQNQNTAACFTSETTCLGKLDGDYPACSPECQDGYYYTCSNEMTYAGRECALGYYQDGNRTFLARTVFDPTTRRCEWSSDSCPRDPVNHEVIPDPYTPPTPSGPNPCLGAMDSCQGRADGDYPMCYPDCQTGFFISCSNGEAYEMPCALAEYTSTNGSTYLARMVYDTNSGSCVREHDYCPRNPQETASSNHGTTSSSGTSTDPGIPACNSPQADVLFVLDSSSSIGSANYHIQSLFVADLSTFFPVGPNQIQFSSLIFSTYVHNLFSFDQYYTNDQIAQALLNADYVRGITRTDLALKVAKEYSFMTLNGARPNAAKVVIVVTDGMSSYPSLTLTAASELKSFGATIIAIGIGPTIRDDELLNIASSPNHVFRVGNYRVLSVIRNAVVETACDSINLFSSCVYDSCVGRADGDYPACEPQCKAGTYYTCTNEFASVRTCALGTYVDGYNNHFYAPMVFDPDSNSCQLTCSSCSRNAADYAVSVPSSSGGGSYNYTSPDPNYCFGQYGSCDGLPDGDYRMCYPLCQSGYYITCSGGEATERPCPNGYYQDENGNSYLGIMVYDASIGTCVHNTSTCPRDYVPPVPTPPSGPAPDPPAIPQCASKGDVLFIIDSSASIGSINYATQLAFLSSVVYHLSISPEDIQVSAIVFSTNAYIAFPFNQCYTQNAAWQSILGLPYLAGQTNTHLALQTARQYAFTSAFGARSNVAKVAVVVTDGVSREPGKTEVEADMLKRAGVTVIAIGVGYCVRYSELVAIASSSNHIFTVNSYGVLDAIKAGLIAATCQGTTNDCVESSCEGFADGDYPACQPGCEEGIYYTCSSGYTYERPCSLGLYFRADGSVFYAPNVYDPDNNSCEQSSQACPRNHEDYKI